MMPRGREVSQAEGVADAFSWRLGWLALDTAEGQSRANERVVVGERGGSDEWHMMHTGVTAPGWSRIGMNCGRV